MQLMNQSCSDSAWVEQRGGASCRGHPEAPGCCEAVRPKGVPPHRPILAREPATRRRPSLALQAPCVINFEKRLGLGVDETRASAGAQRLQNAWPANRRRLECPSKPVAGHGTWSHAGTRRGPAAAPAEGPSLPRAPLPRAGPGACRGGQPLAACTPASVAA